MLLLMLPLFDAKIQASLLKIPLPLFRFKFAGHAQWKHDGCIHASTDSSSDAHTLRKEGQPPIKGARISAFQTQVYLAKLLPAIIRHLDRDKARPKNMTALLSKVTSPYACLLWLQFKSHPLFESIQCESGLCCVVIILCLQRQSTPIPPSNRPKRVKKDTAAVAAANKEEDLVGKRIRVLWPDEKQFFSGTVVEFDEDKVLPSYLEQSSYLFL